MKAVQKRQCKSRRFSSASLGDADHVTPLNDFGDRRGLNGGGFCVSGFLDSLEDKRMKTEGFKRHLKCEQYVRVATKSWNMTPIDTMIYDRCRRLPILYVSGIRAKAFYRRTVDKTVRGLRKADLCVSGAPPRPPSLAG